MMVRKLAEVTVVLRTEIKSRKENDYARCIMHLSKNILIHQIFGANTDVGKTVLVTALVLASASRGRHVRYLKPVSTGPIRDADDEFVKRFGKRFHSRIQQKCLFRFKEPPTDEIVNKFVSAYINDCARRTADKTDVYIETAGGVHSPSISGTSQVDSYRPLRFPVILVGDSKLGGISSTISAYESLLLRGYSVDAIMTFQDDYYRNWEYLSEYFAERDVHVASLPLPPPKLDNAHLNFTTTDSYYSRLLHDERLTNLNDHLDKRHAGRIHELQSMPDRSRNCIWWPFVQHGFVKDPEDVTVIDSAHGDFFSVYTGHSSKTSSLLSPSFDGSASWWTQAFGHAHSSLAIAAARAAGRYGHVMFPQATHLPALKLAEKLVSPNGPGSGWASRVFFSDDGSTAMEVALKMALRAYCTRYGADLKQADKQQLGVLGLKGSYHGDTIGAMDACYAGDGVYTCEWHSAKGFWLDPPTVSMRDGKAIITLPDSFGIREPLWQKHIVVDSLPWVYDIPGRLDTELAESYRRSINQIMRKLDAQQPPIRLAALVLEPLVMGAGGMIFVDPLFQRILIDVVRGAEPRRGDDAWRGLPVIFDEVFVGLYRLGLQSCIPTLGIKPDIAVYAKTLTGGVVPLAVTLASSSIFEAFLSESKADALLHGHSYTAHAVGCEVANKSLAMMDKLAVSDTWTGMRRSWRGQSASAPPSPMWSMWNPEFLTEVSRLQTVNSAMSMGTVLAIKLRGSGEGYRSQLAQDHLQSIKVPPDDESFGIHFRTLGDVAYFMTSLNTSRDTIKELETRILSALSAS
ncbi:PLP-dependent transferase [Sanghuangporus baumii]|uniref:PLP-dependent transferase n=1 Tax=Sanghuangporus baumii TaxID=108892 RepID=A0A9Q5MZP4_SANBA|nr:PLP-dependent transferase [Sanghuangporus baumii]